MPYCAYEKCGKWFDPIAGPNGERQLCCCRKHTQARNTKIQKAKPGAREKQNEYDRRKRADGYIPTPRAEYAPPKSGLTEQQLIDRLVMAANIPGYKIHHPERFIKLCYNQITVE
jgi:hypothetical protein